MMKQIMQKATAASVIFSVCLAILLGLSHARELQADAPGVYIEEVFVETAPGIIEEVAGGQALVLDPLRCWAAIGDVTSCILDFLKNLGNRNLGGISPICCEKFGAISDQCSFNVLPFDPSVSGSIKSICSRLPAPPTKAL